MNTIRRTKKSKLENEKDFYQTHPTMVKALKDWMKSCNYKENVDILDPCCGEGVIFRGLMDTYYNVTYFDRFIGTRRKNFLFYNKKHSIIISNPPYSCKYDFIDHSRKLADVVICLLPLNISNYNMFHDKYQNIPEFYGKIVMTPKLFLSETTDFKPGGTASYAWYIWDKNWSSGFSKEWYYNLRDYL